MISASMVKELRNSTGAGMMDCKKPRGSRWGHGKGDRYSS
mgnify:CR=1 FL=1